MEETFTRGFIFLSLFLLLFSACGIQNTPVPTPSPTQTAIIVQKVTIKPTSIGGSFDSGSYRNLFKEYLHKSDPEIKVKLDAAWTQLFYGDNDLERVYYPVGKDMAYIEDIGNQDVRTEGMSYGMMISVQMDKKEEFDRLLTWVKTYMYHKDGAYQGYFAWHCSPDGTQLDSGPAPDGEEWFAMSLMFASARWGDGTGIYNYQQEANAILTTMLHKTDKYGAVTSMFDPKEKMVVFVPSGGGAGFTDPSYHLPAYYELWGRWANQDQQFWLDAAQTSRLFFQKTANPQTGLMPDYSFFNGQPYSDDNDHKDFRFDAWRTLSNVAVDYAWFKKDPWQVEQSNRILQFLASQGLDAYPNQYSLEGKPLSNDHSTGLVAMAAVAALAADPEHGKPFVEALWDTPIPTGKWRYYDGLLYFMALLHTSGQFKIYNMK